MTFFLKLFFCHTKRDIILYFCILSRFFKQAFIKVQEEFGSFSKYIWGFVDGKPIDNQPKNLSEVKATTPISDALSKDMKKRGFKFVGSTVIYAHMQATGMVNDHVMDCWTRK